MESGPDFRRIGAKGWIDTVGGGIMVKDLMLGKTDGVYGEVGILRYQN